MSIIPPPPPPPLPPPSTLSIKILDANETAQETVNYSNVCEWASSEFNLWEVCSKNLICLHNPPFRYKYKDYKSILQVGPTCGLVALSMLLEGEVSPDELLNIAKMEGYSNNGEMLSCKDMVKLAEKAFSLAEIDKVPFTLKKGGLLSQETIQDLLDGAVLLVPYDADFNHSPCLRQGHTAHWALVCGIIIMDDCGKSYTSNPDNVYVLCRHGKSKFLTAWSLNDLHKSNLNLFEFSPKKAEDGLLYVLPEGGIGGENGLRDKFLMFYV